MASSALDWSLVQAFLAVAEHGSLSAAARVLGATQPTVGRQVKAMEEQLGTELFHRHEKGLQLTEAGNALLPAARGMRDAAHLLSLHSAGTTHALAGSVRITASIAVASYHLPKLVAKVRERHPEIAIEIAPSDETSNLHYREADIAIRMYRPTQLDLITQHLGELELGIFAAKTYVAKHGMPQTPEELLQHDVVGADKDPRIVEGFRRAGLKIERDFFKVRCDELATQLALVRAGCGLGFVQCIIGRSEPELVEIPLGPPATAGMPRLPVWLTAHTSIRHVPRVQCVWDILADGLRELIASQTR